VQADEGAETGLPGRRFGSRAPSTGQDSGRHGGCRLLRSARSQISIVLFAVTLTGLLSASIWWKTRDLREQIRSSPAATSSREVIRRAARRRDPDIGGRQKPGPVCRHRGEDGSAYTLRPMTPERWQQVKALFNQALEREPSARAAFIAEHSGGDLELLTAAVATMGACTSPGATPAPPCHAAARRSRFISASGLPIRMMRRA
jgi:hypothetical protein